MFNKAILTDMHDDQAAQEPGLVKATTIPLPPGWLICLESGNCLVAGVILKYSY